jgi:hypothetical protein
MGPDESVARRPHAKAFDPFMYAPVTSHRNEASYASHPQGHPSSRRRDGVGLLKVAYHGVWSMRFPQTVAPSARVGQCHVYDAVADILYIAYGIDAGGRPLSDLWGLSLRTCAWRSVARSLLAPRAYASATLNGRQMIVFGGVAGATFFADLHAIDLDSGRVSLIRTHGDAPSPRTSPMLIARGDCLYLWGGFDGTARSGVFRVPVGGGAWAHMPGVQPGAPSPVAVCHGDQVVV